MIRIHDRDIRGTTNTGWLDSRHTFSFGHFSDPSRMGFRSLRVINDDRVIPGAGFDTHGHRDMEIITYILSGELTHKDSLGTGSTIRPGEIQRMSAGKGILHSEFNPSNDNGVHLLQIWILPEENGLKPSYEQKTITPREGEFTVIGNRAGEGGAVTIHQDATMLAGHFRDGQETSYSFKKGRGGFLHVAKGWITLNGEDLKEGDGAEIEEIETITVTAKADGTDVLLFDLA